MLNKSLFGLVVLLLGFESACAAIMLPASQIPAGALATITNQALGFTVRNSSVASASTGGAGYMNSLASIALALSPPNTNTVGGAVSAGLIPDLNHPGFFCTNTANFLGSNGPGWAGLLGSSPYAATISGCAVPADANGFWAFNAENFTNAWINCDGNAGADDNNGPFVSNAANGSTNTAANCPKNYFPGIPTTVDPALGNDYEDNCVSFAGYIYLAAGTVTFNVNSDDGFILYLSPLLNPNDAGGLVVLGSFNGGRGAATTSMPATVPSSGWYALRLDYEEGGGGIVCALFTTDVEGNNVLVNDTTNPKALLAYPTPDLWAGAYLVGATPGIGSAGVSPVQPVSILLQDGTNAAVNPNTIAVTINGAAAAAANLGTIQSPSFTPSGLPNGKLTTVTYTPTVATLLPAGQMVTIGVTFNDTRGGQGSASLAFTTAPNLVNGGGAGTNASNQGFAVFPYLTGAVQPNDIVWTELQIAGEWGPNLAQVGANWPFADYGATPFNGYRGSGFIWTNYINWDWVGNTAADGDFQSTDGAAGYPKSEFPGIIGNGYTDEANYLNTTANNFSEVVEAWLYFPKAGVYTMIVNSDDGFVVKSGIAPGDYFGTPLGLYDGGRGYSDTAFTVGITAPGYYPFELLYEEGGGGANCEWITVGNGVRQLVNDSTNLIKAYLSVSNSPPFIFAVSPDPAFVDGLANGQSGPFYPPYRAPSVSIANGNGRTLASARLSLNGVDIPTTLTVSTNGVTIVSGTNVNYIGGTNNTVTVVYTDSGKTSFTNSYLVAIASLASGASDVLHGYTGYLQGNAVYTASGGGHTGKAGDYAVDGTANASGAFYVPSASFVNAAGSNDCMAVSFWVYRYSINPSSAFWFDSPSSSGTGRGYQAHTPWSDDTIYFDTAGCCDPSLQRIDAGVGAFAPYAAAGNDTWWNQWRFFVFSKNGPRDKEIWIDGQLFLQGASSSPLPSDIDHFWLAGGPAGSMDGKIDDFAIYANALVSNGVDGGAVSNLFSGKILPSEVTGVLAYWDFNEVGGTNSVAPTLTGALSGGNLVLGWPSTPSGYSLIGTTNLAGGTWVSITNAPVTTAGTSVVTLPAPKVNWFFELKN